jgi:hypothetical protein
VLEAWFNEGDVVNTQADPSEHFRLRTKFDNKITCLPDAGFLLKHGGQRTAYYLELERGDGNSGTGSRQLAERKAPGYAELARQKVYLKHFPSAEIDEFRVLLILPHDRRRDAVREAFQKKDAAEFRTDLWRFVARTDITVSSMLNREIFFRCGSESPERLTATAGVRAGVALPGATDGPQARKSPDANVSGGGPSALLAGAEPAAEATDRPKLSKGSWLRSVAEKLRNEAAPQP